MALLHKHPGERSCGQDSLPFLLGIYLFFFFNLGYVLPGLQSCNLFFYLAQGLKAKNRSDIYIFIIIFIVLNKYRYIRLLIGYKNSYLYLFRNTYAYKLYAKNIDINTDIIRILNLLLYNQIYY